MRKKTILSLFLLLLTGAPKGWSRDIPEISIDVRLKTPLSSQRSRPGDPIDAVVFAPAMMEDRIVIPTGSDITGNVEAVRDVKERGHQARLLIRFTRLTLPDGEVLPIDARVASVDNARETVGDEGWIDGHRPFSVKPWKFTDLMMALAYVNPAPLATMAGLQLLRREAARLAIVYKPGVDLTLKAFLPAIPATARAPENPSPNEKLADLARTLPVRTVSSGSRKQADITNIVLIGSREEVEQAFLNAGWTTSSKLSLKTRLKAFVAAAEDHSYYAAPVSRLLLNGRGPELVFQKQTDTFVKRHHIRLWQAGVTFDNRPVWVGAATHDVGVAFSASGFRHLVEADIDVERQKVVDDLLYDGAIFHGMADRSNVPLKTRNATGDPLETDGRIAIVALNAAF